MDHIIRDILISRLEVAKTLESKIDFLQSREYVIKKLLESREVFEISIETNSRKDLFRANTSESDSFQPSDLKEVLEVLLCAVSKRLLGIKNQYRQL